MTNLEKNALKIAELLGKEVDESNVMNFCYISDYSSYNGLMRIVFECNNSEYKELRIRIYINPEDCHHIQIWTLKSSEYISDLAASYKYNPHNEQEFIEAIQLAVIKYLELKEKEQ